MHEQGCGEWADQWDCGVKWEVASQMVHRLGAARVDEKNAS